MGSCIDKYGDRGSQGNRISSANSFASYIMYKYKSKRLTITPGIRYESIKLERDDYGKSNPQEIKMRYQIDRIRFQYLTRVLG